MEVSKYSLLGTSPVRSMSISSLGYIFVRLWSYSRLYYLPLLFKKFNENDILKRRVQIPQQILTSLLGLQLPILETVSFIKDPLPHLLDFTSHNGTADHLIKAVQEVGKRAKLICYSYCYPHLLPSIVTLICYPHLLPSLFYTGTNQ